MIWCNVLKPPGHFQVCFFSIEISRFCIKFSLNLKRKHFVLNSLNSLNSSSSSTILTFKLKLGFMRLLFKSEFCIPIKIIWNGNFSIGFYWRATINATSNKALSELSKRLKDWIICQVDNESFKQQRKQTCSFFFANCHWQTLSWLVRHVWDGMAFILLLMRGNFSFAHSWWLLI